MEPNNPSYKILQPLILAATISIGMMIGYKLNDKPEMNLISKQVFPEDSLNYTGRIEELLRFIDNKYVDTINSELLTDTAIQAILAKLDPHSSYMSPDETKSQNDEMNGNYYGIGVENHFINDTVIISNVFEGGPAAQAGLKVFDKIIMVDGDTVAGRKLDYENIRKRFRKQLGQQVELKILRFGKSYDYTIQVGGIKVKSVSSTYLSDIETALIKIDRFGTNTYKEFMEEVEKEFGKNKAKHLILDLRSNPGGYLPEAINILCQIFKEKDKLLLYTEGRSGKRNEYKSTGKYFFNIDKVIVLIDENSASASEIIAGAIQDWDRGIIIGRRSYGKGLVQEQYPLNNGGAIRLTVSRYYTPSGRSIQKDYSDSDYYNKDIIRRYEHGDLFYKDSSTVKNATVFHTKIYKREVSSNGGITPDIFIGLKDSGTDFLAFEEYSLLPEFAFKYISMNPALFGNKSIQLKDDAQYRNAFEIFMTSRLGAAYVKKKNINPSYYFDEFKMNINRILSKIDKEGNPYIKGDQFMIAAIAAIRENKSLKDINQ